MKRLFLVRHARTEWNITGRLNSFTDIGLDAFGLQQAERLAGHLALVAPDASVWASPARRAQETASALFPGRPGTFRTLEAAIEVHFGRFEGRSASELRAGPDRALFEAWEAGEAVDGVEALPVAGQRAKHVLSLLLADEAPGDQVLVTHGLFLRALVCATVLDAPPAAFRRLAIDNASVSTLTLSEAGLRLAGLNDTHFLRGL